MQPETVSDGLVSQVDVMATVAAVVGATLPAGSAPDSYNLLPMWTEGAASPRHSDRPQEQWPAVTRSGTTTGC